MRAAAEGPPPGAPDPLAGLSPAQREAVLAPAGANLVLAGAGSGKTRVLVHRVLRLLAGGLPPERILAITFTNKAAGEMRERLAGALGRGARGLWVGTFHAVCARILRAEADRAGLPREFAILSRGECLALLRREMGAEGLSPERYPPRALLERIALRKTSGAEAGEAALPFGLDSAAARLAPRYARALRAAGAVDFDDLLALPLELFERHPEVRDAYRRRFAEILVDEYQDTNPIQSRLVAALVGETGSVFAVGDDDQSIYRWRGADVGNIRRFERDFPGARVFRLEENYRSSGRILAAAAEVMRRARGRREKRLFTGNPPGGEVVYLAAAAPEVEAEMLLQRLVDLGAGASVPWGEVAVFYRTNIQSRPLEEAARRRGVPYQVVKGQRFFDRAEVQDLAAYLRLLLRPEDSLAFRRIVNRPPRGLGPERLRALAGEGEPTAGRAREALAAGRLRGAAARALEELLEMLADLVAERRGPAGLLEALLERTGYRVWLEGAAAGSASAERRRAAARALEGAAEFVAAAAAFEERLREEEGVDPRSPDALARFLEELALMGEADEFDPEGGKLSLMTLHAAKGLEFRAVAICGVQEGLLPHGRSADEPEALEEERRLLYVGMTRAREHLLLSWTKERRAEGGGAHPSRASRFLELLGDEVLRREGDHAPPEAPRLRRGRRPADRYGEWDDLPRPGKEEGAAAGISPEALGPFAPGARVEHPKFGAGVVAARRGTGERAVVTVDFERVGRKQLVLKYAPLRPAGGGVDGGESAKV